MKKLFIILAIVAMVFVSCKKETSTNSPIPVSTPKKALLVILDGWGIGDQSESDVIAQTPTPYFDYLNATYPHSELQASGEYVGLPDGQMGNSETGHLNIGAGRVIYQDLVMINHACDDNSILQNPEIQSAYSYAQTTGKSLHLMGLTSTGGIHSSIDHLFKLIDIAAQYNIENCYVHCFMDGRDTDPMSGKGFVIDLQPEMSAYELKDRLIEAINTNRYDWIVVNFGNADHAINDDGTPNTAHSTNPVPFIYVTANSNARVHNGVLADVAPTILHIMGLSQPQEMTGQCLINE